jgi:hypothetical protein
MNTAICISGMGRSIEYTFQNIKTRLIDTFDKPDVFVYVAKNRESDAGQRKDSDKFG